MRLLTTVLLAGCCFAQDPRAAMEASIARQRAAIELQQQAVAKQAAAILPPAPGLASEAAPPSLVCDRLPPARMEPLLTAAADRAGLDAGLLSAVIAAESAGRPCAVSPKGALGLMQLMPDTAAMLGVADPLDPEQNVDAGARYLGGLLARYGGDLPLALAAYNAGPGRVDAAGGAPLIRETARYVEEILKRLKPAVQPAHQAQQPAGGPP